MESTVETAYVSRPVYEGLLRKHRDTQDIKVLTGVRRCGKSSMLQWLADDLTASGISPQNVFYRRMDLFGMPLNPNAEWLASEIQKALDLADPKEPSYVLLDEVQDVAGWERVVRQLHTRPNTDVYVTGSNAYVLSSDLATLIGGRYVELRVQPLSFKEFLSFASEYDLDFPSDEAAFSEYLRYGGMPALFHLRERSQENISELLSSTYETVILNDVATRAKISDLDLLSKLVRYVFSTSGTLFSTNKIVQTLTSAGRKTTQETVDSYLRALMSALILSECEQTGLAGKAVLRPQRKFYPVDTGLRNLMRNFAPGDLGLQIENVVYNELVRRGWNVTVGAMRSGEIDFVADKPQGREYFQVTETMADQRTYERELEPFKNLTDAWPKTVLTTDRLNCGVTKDGVNVVNVIDWLLMK